MPGKRSLLMIAVLFATMNGLAPSTATAQVSRRIEPALVGMWQLAMPGMRIYWHIRADGTYRYFGVNARPFEHWGYMEAFGGRWATQWAGGVDGGSYTLAGDRWQESGKAGVGNWQRVWKPGAGGSQGHCPLIDVAAVEALVGSATKIRADVKGCSLAASGVGYADGVTIAVMENAASRFMTVRKYAVTKGTAIDLPGVGTAAYIDGDGVHILKGNRYAEVNARVYPDHPDAVSNEALTRLARSVAARL